MKFSVLTLLSVFIAIIIEQNSAENFPVNDRENGQRLITPSSENSQKMKGNELPMNFTQAFIKTFLVIVISEIGDKTFFIAAIMAMKHPRVMVFLGAISALAFMTVISVLCGWAFSIIPKRYTYYGSVILFMVFGLKMIYDGMKMSPNEAQEEYDEVHAELRKREEEHAKRLKKMSKPKKETVSPTAEIDDTMTVQVPPVVNEYKNGNHDVTSSVKNMGSNERMKAGSIQFEKEILSKDVESGYARQNSRKKIFKMLSHIVVQAFTLTFFAEWGDRSQISTMALAIKNDKLGITVGGIVGHAICTGIAVIGGRFVAQKISVKTVTIVGGFVFILFALITLFLESAEDTPVPS